MVDYFRRDIRGAAIPTTISGSITALSTTWDLVDPTGWPDGTNGPFLAVINRKYGQSNLDGTSPEEKILVATRVGTTLTLADSSSRGADDTTAQAWNAPASIEHCLGRVDIDEANYAVSQTVGQIQAKGDVLTGGSVNRFVRTPAGGDGALWVVDSTTPGGFRFSALPAGAINDPAMFTDALIPPSKLAGTVMTAAQIDALTGDDLFTGHQIYQLDTSVGRPWPGLYIYNGINWTPPWNTAWGRYGGGQIVSAQTNVSTIHIYVSMATDLTFVANRHIEATVSFTYSQNAAGHVIAYVNDGTTNHPAFEKQNGSGEGGQDSGYWKFVSTAGDVTLTPAIATSAGSVDLPVSALRPFRFDVYDRGPAGNPA